MQTRRNFLRLTAMSAVALALPSAASPCPTKGKYHVILLGANEKLKVVVEDHFFFDAPPTEDLKSDVAKCHFSTLKVYKTTVPRRRTLLLHGLICDGDGNTYTEFNDCIRDAIRFEFEKDKRIMDRILGVPSA